MLLPSGGVSADSSSGFQKENPVCVRLNVEVRSGGLKEAVGCSTEFYEWFVHVSAVALVLLVPLHWCFCAVALVLLVPLHWCWQCWCIDVCIE